MARFDTASTTRFVCKIAETHWDDWNVEQAEEPIDEDVYEHLNRLSLRANVVLTIGTAEWIVERFRFSTWRRHGPNAFISELSISIASQYS